PMCGASATRSFGWPTSGFVIGAAAVAVCCGLRLFFPRHDPHWEGCPSIHPSIDWLVHSIRSSYPSGLEDPMPLLLRFGNHVLHRVDELTRTPPPHVDTPSRRLTWFSTPPGAPCSGTARSSPAETAAAEIRCSSGCRTELSSSTAGRTSDSIWAEA